MHKGFQFTKGLELGNVPGLSSTVFQDTKHVTTKKSDDELQIVWGEVYAPNFPDSQGDMMSANSVREMAYGFMAKGDMYKLDTAHSREDNGCFVVESFIARKGDPDFIEGAWVLGVHVPDPSLWQMIKNNEINGFSIDGKGFRIEKEIEIDMPNTLNGMTQEACGHYHAFCVKYDEDTGDFRGGVTSPDPVDGHIHKIVRGTVTEEVNGHSHRFSFVEGVMEVLQ